MSIDYRALIQDRKSKQTRAIVREILCLDPSLYADLEEAHRDLKDALVDTIDADETTGDDNRMGGISAAERARLSVTSAQEAVDEVTARIVAVSVIGVFKAPTSTRQAELNGIYSRAVEAAQADDGADGTSAVEAAAETHNKAYVLETFAHFEEPGKKPIPADTLGKADLADLIATFTQGELTSLASKIGRASGTVVDAPKSVRSSLLSRPSAATSKLPSSS